MFNSQNVNVSFRVFFVPADAVKKSMLVWFAVLPLLLVHSGRCLRRPQFNLREGGRFWRWTNKFFSLWFSRYIFFPAAWSLHYDYYLILLWNYFNYILQAVVSVNSWQLPIICRGKRGLVYSAQRSVDSVQCIDVGPHDTRNTIQKAAKPRQYQSCT